MNNGHINMLHQRSYSTMIKYCDEKVKIELTIRTYVRCQKVVDVKEL